MNFKSLRRKAEQMIEKRGGNQSVKEDAQELMDIAKGQGTLSDKAKRAGDALKDPGAKGPDERQPPPRP
jgi:general stress protein YciG